MIRDCHEEVLRLHAKFSRQEQAQRTDEYLPPTSVLRSDEEVIEKARSEKNGKFDRLWRGDTSDYGYDHSAADDGFVHKLWSYTQDEKQVERIHALSGLHRPAKSGRRPDYLRRSIERARKNVTWLYEWPDEPGQQISPNSSNYPSSSSPSLYKEKGRGRKPEAIKLADVKPPGPRRYILKDLVLAAYVTLLYGDGGVAKSLLALALAVAVAGARKKWLGRQVENSAVLYLDFELDAEEQARRVNQLCSGLGMDRPPDDLLYMSGLGFTARQAFEAALEFCKKHSVTLLVVDSYGIALEGDAEASRDTSVSISGS